MNEIKIIEVIVQHSGNNYCAYMPDVDGCVATGKTYPEVVENMTSAVKFHYEAYVEDNQEPPEELNGGNYELAFRCDDSCKNYEML